eukprot:CAMPEP_0171074960 /NCGR_PEP_ID=MMETSP0766_2-20121228/12476_1 /TAXON_ID=439317 /ORGANISM="Gambierdiscus australes, Strain CAWD 149" /LENGTH=609 /DNA_ID=CAMNT_0011531789 /DNA_START=59 /DNA_END=1885 /DNA_ORIENTATION=+
MAEAWEIGAVVVLLCLSGLFSGLNLGLMSLDQVGLELTVRTGTPREAKWARAILPLRRTGNFLLCTLLLGNTAVNAVLAIFLGDMAGGPIGGIVSTLGIVIMGEIIPQSICSRHGLAVGYYTRFIVVVFMVAMSPLAWPTAKLLDCALGEELSQVFSAFQLRHLVQLNSESGGHGGKLSNFEAKLLMGALRLEERRVKEAVIPLDQMPRVDLSTPVDAQLVHQLFHCSHLCVPVVEAQPEKSTKPSQHHWHVVDFLNVKDVSFYGCLPEALLCVGDIVSWYDTSRILHLNADEKMHEAYQKFTPEHRHFAVVMEGGHPLGFVSQQELMRGWALRNQPLDEDGARFGLKTRRLDNVVRNIALTWRQRTQERNSDIPRQMSNTSERINLTKLSPEVRHRLTALIPLGSTSEALVERKALFAVYLFLVRHSEAFRPSAIKAARAAALLSLPRVFTTEEEGATIVSPGPVQECTVVFEGTVSVQPAEDDPEICNPAWDSTLPIHVFNDTALLSGNVSSNVRVMATSECSVLRIGRLDYLECRRGDLEALKGPKLPSEACTDSEFSLPNTVTDDALPEFVLSLLPTRRGRVFMPSITFAKGTVSCEFLLALVLR